MMNKNIVDHMLKRKMSGIPYIPIEHSRLGPVTPAYVSDDNDIAFGLFPCSKVNQIFGRHGSQCWGTGPSQWLNQTDSSASCIWEQKLDNISAYYTQPRMNDVTIYSGISPMQVARVEQSSQQQPVCSSQYTGFTTPMCAYHS